jgi:hypothetical protein
MDRPYTLIIRVCGIMPENNIMPQLKFIGRISTMGDKLVIVIPKEFHKETQSLRTKQVLVVVEDAIPK